MTGIFMKISLLSLILIILVLLLQVTRKLVQRNRNVISGATWGCGYTAGTIRQQYTGTSYAANFAELAQPVLGSKTEFTAIREEEIFPARRSFSMHPADLFRSAINRIIDFSMLGLKKIARLQTGNIQHYILYAFIFILVIFLLLFLNIL